MANKIYDIIIWAVVYALVLFVAKKRAKTKISINEVDAESSNDELKTEMIKILLKALAVLTSIDIALRILVAFLSKKYWLSIIIAMTNFIWYKNTNWCGVLYHEKWDSSHIRKRYKENY